MHNLSAFKPIALSEDKLALTHVLNDEVTANQKNSSGNDIIFKKLDQGRNDYEDSYYFTDLKMWANKKSLDSFSSFTGYLTE
jgi:hypothetical protein